MYSELNDVEVYSVSAYITNRKEGADNAEEKHNRNMKINKYKILIGVFVFLIINFIYLLTTSLDYQWGDGIELTISANKLGISHPTGYPLYTMLGKLFTSLPFGTIAFRMHYFSATTSALAVLFLFLIICEIFGLYLKQSKNEEMNLFHLIIAASLSVLFGLGRDFWLYSNVAEVYSLNCLFMLLFFYVMLRFLANDSNRYIPILSFILGLGLAHHLLMLSMIPVFLIVILIKKRLVNFKVITLSFILFLIGLSCYAYLFIRASKNPVMNWGNPSNLKNFFWVVTGEQFKITQYSLMDTTNLLKEVFRAFLLLGEQWFDLTQKIILFRSLVSGLILIIFAVSLVILTRINRMIGLLVALAFLFSFILTMRHRIPDNEGYFFINYACIFVALSALIIKLISMGSGNTRDLSIPMSRKYFTGKTSVAIIFIAFNIALYLNNLPYCNRRDYSYAEVYGRFIMGKLAPDSMIITYGDNDIYSLWYQKYIENNRKDVTIFGANFLWSEWYRNYFEEELKSGKVRLNFTDRIFITETDYLNFLVREILEPNYDKLKIYSTYIEPNLKMFNRYEYVWGGMISFGLENRFWRYIAMYAIPTGAVWRIKKIEHKSSFFIDEFN